jgi:hypothetical protein
VPGKTSSSSLRQRITADRGRILGHDRIAGWRHRPAANHRGQGQDRQVQLTAGPPARELGHADVQLLPALARRDDKPVPRVLASRGISGYPARHIEVSGLAGHDGLGRTG